MEWELMIRLIELSEKMVPPVLWFQNNHSEEHIIASTIQLDKMRKLSAELLIRMQISGIH